MKPIVERSDDLRRGDMPHVRKAIERLSTVRGVTCARCRKADASHLIAAMRTPKAVCSRCASTWAALSPLERRGDLLRMSTR